jgi:hypothetical protein
MSFKACLFATMVAALGLSADASAAPINLKATHRNTMKQLSQLAEKPAKHSMRLLQTASSTGGGDSLDTKMVECMQKDQAYATWFQEMGKVCTDLGAVTGGATGTDRAAAMKAVDTFCAGQCYAKMASPPPGLLQCLGPAGDQFVGMFGWMCAPSDVAGEKCGILTYDLTASMTSKCGMYSRDMAKCTADTTCEYDSADSKCSQKVTKGMLDMFCGKCMQSLLTGPAASQLGSSVDTIGQQRALLCVKASGTGEYCMIKVGNFNPDSLGNATAASLDTLCGDAVMKECVMKIVASVGPMMQQQAEAGFMRCVKGGIPTATCAASLQQAAMATRQMTGPISRMCMKNNAGKYCMAAIAEVEPKLKANPACAAVMATKTCDATCDAMWKGVYDDMGCCLGMAQEIFFAPGMPPPNPPGYVLPTGAPVPTVAAANFKKPADGEIQLELVQVPAGSLIELKACASLASMIEPQLTVQCGKVVPPIKKSLGVKISFAAVNKDAALKEKVKTGLRADVAASIGVSTEDIRNDKITENTGIVVSSTARHMKTLATNSGINYEFELVTADPAVAQNAGTTFDKKTSTGDVTLTATAAVATSSDCVNCVSKSQSGSTASSLTQPQASSARAVGASAAAVVAAAFALLL